MVQRILFGVLSRFAAAVCHGADTYPAKLVRWMIAFPPGGETDVISRTLAQKLTGVRADTESKLRFPSVRLPG